MPVFARVRDAISGHHYDVGLDRLDQLVAAGAAEEVTAHARHEGKPCPPKPRRPIAAPAPQSTKRAAKAPAEAVAEPKESESS